MIPNSKYKFNSLLNGQINNAMSAKDLAPLNPFNRSEINTTTNQGITNPNSPQIGNYNWSRDYFSFFPEKQFIRITDNILKYSSQPIKSQILQTTDGNLTYINVPKNQLNRFSANIYRIDGASTKLNIGWSESILVNLNNIYVTSNQEDNEYTSQYTEISLTSGWNRLDIYIYSSTDGENFTINSSLGEVSDQWGVPTISSPVPPSGLLVQNDYSSAGTKDPNSNIITWDSANRSVVSEYKLYRRGPYNSGLVSPLLDGQNSSGYFISGAFGVLDDYRRYTDTYYLISAINSGGESLPSTEIHLKPSVSITGVFVLSGNMTANPGALNTGNYTYYVFPKSSTGEYVASDYVGAQRLAVSSSSGTFKLSWNIPPGNYGFDIYRNPISFDDLEPNFGLSGYFITGVSSTEFQFLDSGSPGILITGIRSIFNNNEFIQAEPRKYFPGNSYRLTWGGVQGADSYNVYRTFQSGLYDKNSFVYSVASTGYIDSGITPSQLSLPVVYQNIANINYGINSYKDIGLIKNRTYTYSLSSVDYNSIEGDLSTGVFITAGDQVAPSTPSGISGTYFNGFSNIRWQNGVERDLVGTIIYQSGSNGLYNEISRISAPTNFANIFTSYSGVFNFKLANFDTSDNISTLSSFLSLTGTNTLQVGNIIASGLSALTGYLKNSTDTMLGVLNFNDNAVFNAGADIEMDAGSHIGVTQINSVGAGVNILDINGAGGFITLFAANNSVPGNSGLKGRIIFNGAADDGSTVLVSGNTLLLNGNINIENNNSGVNNIGSPRFPFSGVYTKVLYASFISGLSPVTFQSDVKPTNSGILSLGTSDFPWANFQAKTINSIGASQVFNEVPVGAINGVNTTYTLANTPGTNTVRLYVAGLRLNYTVDFTITGKIITTVVPPVLGVAMVADYNY